MKTHAPLPSVKDLPADRDDPIGRMFEQMQLSGEHMGMRIGRVERASDPSCAPRWFFLPHWRSDGMAAFSQVLTEQGHLVPALKLGRQERPGFFARLGALFRQINRIRKLGPWRPPHPAWASPSPEPTECANAAAWRVLTAEQTRAVASRARQLGISSNSYLLWAVDQMARTAWLPAQLTHTMWLVPVNMRGSIQLSRETANHVSWMDVELLSARTPSEVHERVRQTLALNNHWGAWNLMKLTARLGPKAMQAAIQGEVQRGVVHAGVFSNIGEWSDGASAGSDLAWIVAPQTTRKIPIASASVCWNGRLSVMLQAHPMLEVTDAQVGQWVERWVELLIGEQSDAVQHK